MAGIEIISQTSILTYNYWVGISLVGLFILIIISAIYLMCVKDWYKYNYYSVSEIRIKRINAISEKLYHGFLYGVVGIILICSVGRLIVRPTVPTGDYEYKIIITDAAKYHDVVNTYEIHEEKDNIYTVTIK